MLMTTALLFAPSLATDNDDWVDTDRPAAQAAENPAAAEAPAAPQRPNVSITTQEMNDLTRDEYRTYDGLCRGHIDNVGHWEHPLARWYEGTGTASYDSCASREDIARRIQRQHHEAPVNERLRWEYAMQMAGGVHDILKSYLDEREHQRHLEKIHTACNATSWMIFFGLTGPMEITRKVKDDQWWGNVHPHIVKRRTALTGEHAFRNALEVFLQLRDEGRSLEDIRHKYPEVLAALNAVIDPTEEQLNQLKNYDRTKSA